VVGLILSVPEFSGPRRWRWLLAEEESGLPLADHEVDLGGCGDEYAAFTDLYRYLRWNAVPDRRTASEAQIVARVGAWAGQQVLGPAIGEAITVAAPVTVRVAVPSQAGFLSGWPLELAYAGGAPLAARGDVTFVYDLASVPAAARDGGWPRPSPGPLRMLAVFSLPTKTSVLALRRERFELVRLARRIGARQRRRIELTIAQYGVTRDRLAEIVQSGAGWDVLHLSGHGARGQFLLEHTDGSPDPIDTGELLGLLGSLRRRVRLVVVSACESAAATTAETLRWVGLEEQAVELEQQDAAGLADVAPGGAAGPVLTGIARALVERLGCAVVAMRYPVTDEFAIALTGDLYDRVLGRGQNLGAALARAVAETAGSAPSPSRPPICLATPVLTGGQAAELVLLAPAGPPVLDLAMVRMERFPSEPERFVGRAQTLAQSSAALAAASGRTGVLLHGMAGSGKTACALELAYRHQDSFQAVAFWQAPEQPDQFAGALAGLAAALEIQLGDYGFAMADHITTTESLARFTPRLSRILEDNGILLVLDNLETLLTGSGAWRDPRWAQLMTALIGHRGESRVILTSRTTPAALAAGMLTLPVHALSLEEAAALARELPHLRGLLHADASPLRDADPTAVAADRDLVRRVLHVVQGHPKLMELADAAAADPPRLATQLDAAGASADGKVLDAFFRDGATHLDAAQFLDALTGWTTIMLAALPGPTQLMAQFLACLEDSDRQSAIIDDNWADLWRRLGRPGEAPGWRPLAAALVAAALIQADQSSERNGGEDPAVSYRMHPGVAQAIRAAAGSVVQSATDTELGAFWATVADEVEDHEGGKYGQVVVTAGLSAAPYLLRLQEWETAGMLLGLALNRDRSPGTIEAIVPPLRVIADATRDVRVLNVLGRALLSANPAEAERLLRAALDQAVADEDFSAASGNAGDLINLLRHTGRLREALDLTGQQADYTRRAGLGPWSQLADQGWRLQILAMMGRHQQVLDEIVGLVARMEELPSKAVANEIAIPWNVREAIFDIGRSSALALEEWQRALDYNQADLDVMRTRGASAYDLAVFAFNDYAPFIRLGRVDDADRVLIGCQQIFEDNNDLDQLGNVFAARADLEDERGNLAEALAFQQTAIRYHYLRRDPDDIASDHNNLAIYLAKAGTDPAAQRAHRLAAALIRQLTGMTHRLAQVCAVLARELREASQQQLPATVPEVIAVTEQTEGVKLSELVAALTPDPRVAVAALAQVLDTVARMADTQSAEIQQFLEQWEPIIARTAAATGGDRDAAAELESVLDRLGGDQDWAALAAVLRRIGRGERGGHLLDGLDSIDTAIAGQVLTRIAQPETGNQS
jgi:tetratricopeptide (TPR) repeat protein